MELGSNPHIHVGEQIITFTRDIPEHMLYLPAIRHAMNQERPSSHITVQYTEVNDTPIGLFVGVGIRIVVLCFCH